MHILYLLSQLHRGESGWPNMFSSHSKGERSSQSHQRRRVIKMLAQSSPDLHLVFNAALEDEHTKMSLKRPKFSIHFITRNISTPYHFKAWFFKYDWKFDCPKLLWSASPIAWFLILHSKPASFFWKTPGRALAHDYQTSSTGSNLGSKSKLELRC